MIKKTLSIIILLVTNCYLKAQDTTITYFDSKWNETEVNSQVYYRKLYRNKDKLWVVEDYYSDSKECQMKGQYLNRGLKKEHGEFIYYFENGVIDHKGLYEKGKKYGEWIYYFKNGNTDYSGAYIKGKRHGEWNWYFKNGKIASREIYKYGELIKIEQWDTSGVKIQNPIKLVDASFVGGEANMNQFIIDNLVYPDEASQKGQHGIVYIQFVVEKDGSLANIEISKGAYPMLNEAALEVVQKMPNWIPGRHHNRCIRMIYTLPINFRLG